MYSSNVIQLVRDIGTILRADRAVSGSLRPDTRERLQELVSSYEQHEFRAAKAAEASRNSPLLGLATTAELLGELTARAEAGGYADYRTVD